MRSMNENEINNILCKLRQFGILQTFSIVDKTELCRFESPSIPQVILQNTISRELALTTHSYNGHWICYFNEFSNGKQLSMYYDSFGMSPTYYNVCSINNCVHVNKMQHQPHSSTLCGLYCLFFITCKLLGYSNTKIFFTMFSNVNLHLNDKLVQEYMCIIIKSKNRNEFVWMFKKLLDNWCKNCGYNILLHL